MFKPRIYLPLNISRDKQNNQLLTSSFKNQSINLVDWLGIDLINGSSTSVLAQNGTFVPLTTPASPNNSIQYNDGGVFGGDALFIRDADTTETTIATSGTGTLLMGGVDNNTTIEINDADETIFIQALESMEFGDPNSIGNGTTIVVEDVNKHIYLKAPLGQVSIGDSGSVGNDTVIEVDDLTELVKITNVPTFANDAAALAGSLVSGNLYKTTTGGITALNIVP